MKRLLMSAFSLLYVISLPAQELGADSLPSLQSQRGKGWQVKSNFYQEKGLIALLPTIRSSFDIPTGQLVVIGKVIIEAGAQANFVAGTTVYCEPGSEIIVRGQLNAVGTPDARVEFRNLPAARTYVLLNPSDTLWRGISIDQGGAVNLTNVLIAGAQKGISDQSVCDSLTVKNLIFHDANQAAFTIQGVNIDFTQDSAFSLSCDKYFRMPQDKPQNQGKVKVIISSSFGVVALAGLAGVFVFNHQANTSIKKANTEIQNRSKAEEYYQESKVALERRKSMAFVAAAAGLCAGITLIIPIGR
jgi:hypothetical protein